MIKVQILIKCEHCLGEAYLPIGETVSCTGEKYIRYRECPQCQGSGSQPQWVSLEEFANLFQQTECQHTHTSHHGSFYFTEGEVWDDITEVCEDCGAKLDDK